MTPRLVTLVIEDADDGRQQYQVACDIWRTTVWCRVEPAEIMADEAVTRLTTALHERLCEACAAGGTGLAQINALARAKTIARFEDERRN